MSVGVMKVGQKQIYSISFGGGNKIEVHAAHWQQEHTNQLVQMVLPQLTSYMQLIGYKITPAR